VADEGEAVQEVAYHVEVMPAILLQVAKE